MKRVLFFAVLMATAFILIACSTDRTLAPEPESILTNLTLDQEQVAADLLHIAGWAVEEQDALPLPNRDKSQGDIVAFDRTEVAPGIAHYRWEIQVGADDRDKIALHRVVKENSPECPIKAHNAIFLQHGDAKDFAGMFLPGTLSENTADDFGAAIYWARENMDVWGIDQAWNLVPAETGEFGFMADWGIDKQSADLGFAISVARLARLATGNGYRKMILLGYSSGSWTGYALANAEAVLPPGQRQIGGWIPVDNSPVTDNEEWNEVTLCQPLADLQVQLDNGEYGYFVGFDFLGMMARMDPDGASPAIPGFTNLQAAMFVGGGQVFGVDPVHYLAAIWENGLPVDFVHVSVDQWLDFMIAGAPWEPVKFMHDYSTWGCGDTDVPWDDNFGDITIPVLNIGGAGGIAPTTGYCLTLLGSSDITDITIQLESPEDALFDYGHIDLWIAENAPELVWEPILNWVQNHTPGGNGGRHHNRH
jgi:hypothetical protein